MMVRILRNAWAIVLAVYYLAYRSAPASTEMLPPYLLHFAGLTSLLVECLTFLSRMVTFFFGGLEIFLLACGGSKQTLPFECFLSAVRRNVVRVTPKSATVTPPMKSRRCADDRIV